MSIEITTAVVAALALVGTVALRGLSRGRVEIKLNDAIIAAIAAALVLLVSGRISKLVVGSEGLTVETAKEAILSASARPIEGQVANLPVEGVEEAMKGDVSAIPQLVQKQVQALDLMLGAQYVPDAMKQYLETLTKYPFFRFVVLIKSDQTMYGIFDASKLTARLQAGNPGFQDFTNLVAHGGEAELAQLPGFLPADAAVKRQSDKRDVLEKMEQKNAEWLPVLTEQGKLDGIVDRSRLTASMIIEVADKLRANETNPSQ
jgi:CBS domain protein